MFKRIIGTAGSRIVIAFISLGIALLNAKYLGPEGLGTIGLIVLGITIILLVNNFIGGPTLVYLVPREDNFKLLVVSYLWALMVIGIFTLLLYSVHMVPAGFETDVLLLSMICSFFNINLYLLLGNQKIKEYNIVSTAQQIIQLAGLVLFFIILKKPSVNVFIAILYVSYIFSFISSGWMIRRLLGRGKINGLGEVFRKILKLGTLVQVAYTIQMMNYRLSYYIIDSFIGRSGLGAYHFGNQLAEGTWVIGKSVSIVQYSGISNSNDKDYAKTLTIQLLKFTFIASLAVILLLLFIPDNIFLYFGTGFAGTKLIIVFLAAGIIANSLSMMFSHYFAGLGKPQYNTIGSFIGFLFTVGLGFTLIPALGIKGAAITASFSYLASLVYQAIIFFRMARPSWKDFCITSRDIKLFREELIKILGRPAVREAGIDNQPPV